MTMYVLVEHEPEGKVTASLIGMPTLMAQAASEHEAIAQLRILLAAQLHEAKIVPVDIEPKVGDNPWLQLSDRLKDNPLLEEISESITLHRSELDALTAKA